MHFSLVLLYCVFVFDAVVIHLLGGAGEEPKLMQTDVLPYSSVWAFTSTRFSYCDALFNNRNVFDKWGHGV